MLTPCLMAQMDHGHLIAAVHCETDPLTSTALERELLARLEACVDEHDDALIEVAEAYDFAAEDIKTLGDALIENAPVTAALLKALDAAGIHDPEALTSRLTLAEQFCALADDAGDVFTRLAQLTPTTEQTS